MTRCRVIETFLPVAPDPAQHSPAYKIFHYEWEASVPYTYVYTEQYMRQAGQLISEPGYDQRVPNQMVGGRYTIAQLADLFEEGAQIQLQNPVDAKTIYDLISRHLEDWSTHLSNNASFEYKNAPMDDLMLLSRLADELYGFAARFFNTSQPRGTLARRLDQMRNRFSGIGRRRLVKADPNVQVERPVMPNHSDLTKNILEKGMGRDRWS